MSDDLIHSNFWLDQERYSEYIDPTPENKDGMFSIDLVQLASVRRIISNYVDILTGQSIPVFFKSSGDSYNVGGKEIYITTAIKRRKDFDQAVGLALHEAAHTLLTDFNVSKAIPFNTPKVIWDFGRKHNIKKATLERFLKTMFNIVEDWYIDDWVISRAPGYVGYYEASYNVCFNNSLIDQILLSNEYRYPSFESYQFRIINFCNPLTDLQALPGLEEIAKIVDISNISRLKTTKERIKIAYKIVEIVTHNLQQYHDKSNVKEPQKSDNKKIDVDAFFKSSKNDKETKKSTSSKTDSKKTIQDIADTLGNRQKQQDDENKTIASQVSKSPEKELPKEIIKTIEKQMQYVHGNADKKELNPVQKNMLDLIEKHGIVLVYVPIAVTGNEAAMQVGCIVVKKLTMELIMAGSDIFPMASSWKDIDGNIQPDQTIADAVKKGIELGNKLGKKLIIRREINQSKQIRKKSGSINRRLLYSVGYDAEDIFEKIKTIQWNKGSLHITVDASNSMSGDKWLKTMTMTVAVCRATSMVDNIHVTVSFRATKIVNGIDMPYVVLAYDSKKDKFSKVKKLFKYLKPCGCTPEGLSFAAIMNLFTKASPDEEDRYFLNISDGEPYFQMKSPVTGNVFHYADENGVEHTKNQISKIRRQGINILSYYIQDETQKSLLGDKHDTKHNFQIMYGKDARYIKINNVIELATTINELFLRLQ